MHATLTAAPVKPTLPYTPGRGAFGLAELPPPPPFPVHVPTAAETQYEMAVAAVAGRRAEWLTSKPAPYLTDDDLARIDRLIVTLTAECDDYRRRFGEPTAAPAPAPAPAPPRPRLSSYLIGDRTAWTDARQRAVHGCV